MSQNNNTFRHLGYKLCRDETKSYNILVTLEILGENNENRTVVNKNFAKFRTDKVKVLDFEYLLTGEVYNKKERVYSDWNFGFYYEKGKIIEEKKYNKDINVVCSEGIHYFLTKEAVVSFAFDNFYIDKNSYSKYLKSSGELPVYSDDGNSLYMNGNALLMRN